MEEYPDRNTARSEAFEKQAREQMPFTGFLLLRLFCLEPRLSNLSTGRHSSGPVRQLDMKQGKEKKMETVNNTEQTQAENMGNETDVQGFVSGDQKTFTQDEVNGIIQSRISRMKSQAAKEARTEYEQKLAELQAREMQLLVKEHLQARGMAAELAGVLTCTDEDDLKAKLDVLQQVYGDSGRQKAPTGFIQIGVDSSGNGFTAPDPVRKAMGLK